MQHGMIETNFQDLRRKKSFEEKRDLPLRTIAAETGLALATVHRFSSGKIDGVRLDTLDKLCRYFGVRSVADLIEFRAN
jgi:DNA-binding Xre family transcriptional regulator